MKPTGPIPPYFSADDDGQLLIGGYHRRGAGRRSRRHARCSSTTIISSARSRPVRGPRCPTALRFIIPLPQTLTSRCSISLADMSTASGSSRRGELERLKRAELAGIPMTFAGPGKRDDELEAGIAAGATISVESEGEAARAILAGEKLGIQPKIAVRVNPPFAIENGRVTMGARPSPFGVDAERVPALVQGLIEAGVDWRGLHMFAGAQCLDAEALIEAHQATVACAGEIADALGMPLPELNLGGGFDVALLRRRAAARHRPRRRRAPRHLVQRPRIARDDALSLELGRWLVGEVRRLSDPRPRPHRELRPDLPHHRRRRPSSARAPPAACASAARGNYPDRGRQPLRCAARRAGDGHRLPAHAHRRARRRGHAARAPSPAT